MKSKLSLSLLVLFFVLGCHANPAKRTVALLDISGSIYPDEVDREFAEMQTLAANLQRGDQLILIPITGNARNDTPGHIVRLVAPAGRAPFDSDVVAFRREAKGQIEQMKDWARRNPGRRTDIFGTLAVARPELQAGRGVTTKLIILSDLIEDDGAWDFSVKHGLPTMQQAVRIKDTEGQNLKTTNTVQMERLRSRDRAALSPSHLKDVDVFWSVFFKAGSS